MRLLTLQCIANSRDDGNCLVQWQRKEVRKTTSSLRFQHQNQKTYNNSELKYKVKKFTVNHFFYWLKQAIPSLFFFIVFCCCLLCLKIRYRKSSNDPVYGVTVYGITVKALYFFITMIPFMGFDITVLYHYLYFYGVRS